jgi:hypothetical protein
MPNPAIDFAFLREPTRQPDNSWNLMSNSKGVSVMGLADNRIDRRLSRTRQTRWRLNPEL